MKFKFLAAAGFAAFLYSCDDSTTGIGNFVADADEIEAYAKTYNVDTKTVLVKDIAPEGLYSRTSSAYLGKITDEDFGEFTTDFITQVYCPEDFAYPETLTKITSTTLELYYHSYYGDSVAPMQASVKLLRNDTGIIDDGKHPDIYYTTYTPEDYVYPEVIGQKDYAAYDNSVSDSVRYATDDNGDLTYYPNITIDLSNQTVPQEIGSGNFNQYIFDKYKENPENFKDGASFINNVLSGFYVYNTSGEGSVLYILDIWLRTRFEYTMKDSEGNDSIVEGSTAFAASKEIYMRTRLQNDEKLEEFTGAGHSNETYLKTPAGLWTEVTLPLQDIYDELSTDTLNSVSLSFTKYKDTIEGKERELEMGTPQYLLLIRKNEVKDFFENNQNADNQTSFLASYNSSSNTYTFSSLNRLISHIFSEIRNSEERPADWDKLLLIPVQIERESESTNSSTEAQIIGISHDLEVNSARLFRGNDDNPLQATVIYTRPHEE